MSSTPKALHVANGTVDIEDEVVGFLQRVLLDSLGVLEHLGGG